MRAQFRPISTQGQIAIGKKFSGKNVKIEKYADGTVILTPIEITPTFEFHLMKDPLFQKGLAVFGEWELEKEPQQTDLDTLMK